MRATTEMNALNVDVNLKIQKVYKYINPLNLTVSKTRQYLLDSGLVALIKEVTFVNRENSVRPFLVRKKNNRKKHTYIHISRENPEVRKIFPDGSIIVANKRCKNLKELLARADPYDVREDLLPNPVGGYKICGKKCDSCNNMVDSTSELFVNIQERSFQFDDP